MTKGSKHFISFNSRRATKLVIGSVDGFQVAMTRG